MLYIGCQLGQYLPSKDVINDFAKKKVPTEHNDALNLYFPGHKARSRMCLLSVFHYVFNF